MHHRQDNKLENCYIWLVMNCTMMHGLTNLTFIQCHLIIFCTLLKDAQHFV